MFEIWEYLIQRSKDRLVFVALQFLLAARQAYSKLLRIPHLPQLIDDTLNSMHGQSSLTMLPQRNKVSERTLCCDTRVVATVSGRECDCYVCTSTIEAQALDP